MRHRRVLVMIVLMAPLVLVLQQGATPAGDPSAQPPEKGVKPPETIPDEAKAIRKPVPASKDSIEQGKLIFSSQCVMCHGVKGDGTGDLVGRLKLSMPDFTDAEQQKQWTDGEIFWVIKNGHARMPGQRDRFDDEVWWNIVNYIRTLSSS